MVQFGNKRSHELISQSVIVPIIRRIYLNKFLLNTITIATIPWYFSRDKIKKYFEKVNRSLNFFSILLKHFALYYSKLYIYIYKSFYKYRYISIQIGNSRSKIFFYSVEFHLSESIRGQTICIIGVRVIEVCRLFLPRFSQPIRLENYFA